MMTMVMDSFREGGAATYLVLVSAFFLGPVVFVALVAAIVSRATNQGLMWVRLVTLAVLLLSFLPVCSGYGGYLRGQQQVEQALLYASPEMQDTLRQHGEHIARIPWDWGCMFGTHSSSAPPWPSASAFRPPAATTAPSTPTRTRSKPSAAARLRGGARKAVPAAPYASIRAPRAQPQTICAEPGGSPSAGGVGGSGSAGVERAPAVPGTPYELRRRRGSCGRRRRGSEPARPGECRSAGARSTVPAIIAPNDTNT